MTKEQNPNLEHQSDSASNDPTPIEPVAETPQTDSVEAKPSEHEDAPAAASTDTQAATPPAAAPEPATQDNASTTPSPNTAVAGPAADKKKRVIAIVAAVVAAIILAFIVFSTMSAEQAKAEYNAYVEKLEKVQQEMIDGAVEAESLGSKVHDIWHAAIWEDDKNEWDAEIQPYFATDFNEALSNFATSVEGVQESAKVAAMQELVEEDMKELQNPPEGCERAYDAFSDVFDDYSKFCELATNPSGSLTSFTSTFNTLDTELASSIGGLSSKIPAKKE